MPSTSTPKVDTRTRCISKRDVETAFGFDDTPTEMDGNYSMLISPIPSTTTSHNRLQPVWKANPLTQRNVEETVPKKKTLREEKTTTTTTVVDKTNNHELKAPEAIPESMSEFSQLLGRYKEDEIVEPILQIDPKKIIKTYASKR